MFCWGCSILLFNQIRHPVLAPLPCSEPLFMSDSDTSQAYLQVCINVSCFTKVNTNKFFILTPLKVNESPSTHFSGSRSESFTFPSWKLVGPGLVLFFLFWPLCPSCLSTSVSSRLLSCSGTLILCFVKRLRNNVSPFSACPHL